MVQRVLEPELMEEEEQARAYAEADFEEPHSRFIGLLVEHSGALPEAVELARLSLGPAVCPVVGTAMVRCRSALPVGHASFDTNGQRPETAGVLP